MPPIQFIGSILFPGMLPPKELSAKLARNGFWWGLRRTIIPTIRLRIEGLVPQIVCAMAPALKLAYLDTLDADHGISGNNTYQSSSASCVASKRVMLSSRQFLIAFSTNSACNSVHLGPLANAVGACGPYKKNIFGKPGSAIPMEVFRPSLQWSATVPPSMPLMLICANEPVTLSKPVAKIRTCERVC